MHFIIRFLILSAFTFGLLSAASESWRKHNGLLMVFYLLAVGVIFLV